MENIDSVLEEIYDDISLNKEDKENLELSCKNFLCEELKRMQEQLENRMKSHLKTEVEEVKNKKIDRFNKNMNNITENTLKYIAEEFDLDETEVLEQNKDNLLKINDYHSLYSQNYKTFVFEEQDDQEEENQQEDKKEELVETKQEVNKTKKLVMKEKKEELDNSYENDTYTNHLIKNKKCPAFIKGKYCEKDAKHGHYCGYHKKFNV